MLPSGVSYSAQSHAAVDHQLSTGTKATMSPRVEQPAQPQVLPALLKSMTERWWAGKGGRNDSQGAKVTK